MVMRRIGGTGVAVMAACALAGAGAARADAASERAAAVDQIFGRWNVAGSPGCAVSVRDHGRAVLERGYGAANLETGTPVTPDTVFDVGSMTKQFTAASILLLAEDGKLTLDDDVRKYVPELPDYGATITIRRLLNHTSGLRDYVSLLSFADVDFADLSTKRQALDMLVRQKGLNNAPGDKYLYSNSNFFLAAVIVERVSGMSLRDFMAKRLFEPLGMAHTQISDDFTRLIPSRAAGYARAEDGGWARWESHWNEVGDGGVWTTVRDLELWDRNFAEPKVGGADFAARMTELTRLNDGTRTHYALGLMVDDHGGYRMVHHGGASGGFRSELVRFPDAQVSVAVLCNSGSVDASALAQDAADLWLPPRPRASAAASSPPPAKGPPARAATVDGWAGIYRNPETGALRTVEAKDGKATITAFGGRFALRPVGGDTAELVDGPMVASFRFTPASAGRPASLTQMAMEKSTDYERMVLAHPSLDAMQAYVGDYACPELGLTYRFALVDGRLTRRDPRGDPWTFDALDTDRFGYGNLTVAFQRHGGAVDGAVLDIGRARGMACRRIPG